MPPPSPSLRGVAAMSSSSSTSSSSRFNARGRIPWRRGFCNPPWENGCAEGGGEEAPQLVSGDSHLRTVRNANYGSRRGHMDGGAWVPRGPSQQPYRQRHPPYGPPPQSSYVPPPPFGPPQSPYPHPPSSYVYPPPSPFGPPQSPYGPPQPPLGYFPPSFNQPRPSFRPSPPPRPADYRKWSHSASQPPSCERFVVLSYNILADYLAMDHRSKLYFHIPQYILNWEWRMKRLLLEFRLWAPDIMCLQEVDHFHDLKEELERMGYSGIWKMRTGSAVDGCAIFWRTSRFQLRHEEHIEFNKLGLRDNVAQICVFESKIHANIQSESPTFPESLDESRQVNQVVICNIHVLYNPKRGEIKLGQVRTLLNRAYAVSKNWNDAPVIVCGDFNCTPKSPLYNFICNQKLDISGLARDTVSGQNTASSLFVSSSMPRARPMQQGNGFQNSCMPQNDKGNISEEIPPQNDKENISEEIPPQNDKENISEEIPDLQGGATVLDIPHSLPETQFTSNVSGSHVAEGQNMNDLSVKACSDNFLNKFGDDSKICEEPNDNLRDTRDDHSERGTLTSCNSYQSSTSIRHALTEEIIDVCSLSVIGRTECPQTNQKGLEELLDKVNGACSENNDSFFGVDLSNEMKNKVTMASLDADFQGDPNVARIQENNKNPEPYPFDNKARCLTENEGEDKSHATEYIIWNVASQEDIVSADSHTSQNQISPLTNLTAEESSLWEPSVSDSSPNTDSVHPSLSKLSETVKQDSGSSGLIISVKSFDGSSSNNSDNRSVSKQQNAVGEGMPDPEENSDPNFFRDLLGTEEGYNFSNNSDLSPPNIHEDATDNSTPDIAGSRNRFYNPYLWTPMEVEVASGNAECTSVEHSLKLRSVYTDVEDYAGTKDINREPQVTSYNSQFMGTVDYIWSSEGLKTVKVLDTIPKHVLQQTRGFPTRKWGSDHVALACQLAFTDRSSAK